MARYIDAERAKRIIIKTEWENKGIPLAFCQMIDLMPTADVVEVKHGEWIDGALVKVGGLMKVCPSVVCSDCGITFCDFINNHKYMYRYCPHCGARMDGKGAT